MHDLEQVTPHKGQRTRMLFDEVQVFSGHLPNGRIFRAEQRRIVEMAFGGHHAVGGRRVEASLNVFEELDIAVGEDGDGNVHSDERNRFV